jgi:superfamily I DNA and RNA helicase
MGIGINMDGLISEWESLKSNDFKLKFTYPSLDEKQNLKLINKELTGKRKSKEKRLKSKTNELFKAVESGEIDAEELIENIRRLQNSKNK